MLIGNLQRDVTDDKAVLRDWDFPLIHLTAESDSGCLETSIRIVYCAAFDCNVNSSKSEVTCSWLKFLTEPILFKKNFKPTKHSRLSSLRENLFRCDPDQRRWQPWVILVLKSL